MNRKLQKAFDFIYLNKTSILGLAGCYWVSQRFSRNMDELERNTQEKKLFDPIKAKAQVQVYKEIYNLDNDSQEADKDEDGALRILKSASENDKEAIKKFFDKQINNKGKDQSQIDAEMDRLQSEIAALEDVTSGHQGFKFYRTIMTKDTFEDALIELREKEFDKKFRGEKEKMIGDPDNYKTI